MAQLVIKQNSTNAALLVITATLIIWYLFNLVVPAYPPRVSTRAVAAQSTIR